MAKNFTSQLKVQAKGQGPGSASINKSYTLHSKDEMELMNQSVHLAGLQDDIISINRSALTQDATWASRPQGSMSLTVTTKTNAGDGQDTHEASITWHGLDQATLQAALNAINARLVAVGITP